MAQTTPPVASGDAFRLLTGLSSPAISPDGKSAALVVRRVLWDDDRRSGALELVDLATGTSRSLTQPLADVNDPAFSPDGTRIAFLASQKSEGDATQIFVVAASGGTAMPVTHERGGVDAFAWRPDGVALAYSAADADAPKTGAERFRDSFLFTTEPIVARAAPHPVHLYAVTLDGAEPVQLTFGPQSLGDGEPISWSPDGRTIAITLCPNEIGNDQSYSHVVLVDVATKQLRTLTGRTMWEGGAVFSPDGRYIVYAYSPGDPQVNLTRLYLTTPHGGAGVPIGAAIDRPIGDFVWSADSQSVLATAPDGTTNALYRISLRNGAAARLDVGSIVPGVPLTTTGGAETPSLAHALAPDGTLIFLGSATQQPPELFAYSDGSTRKVSDFNAALTAFHWASAQRIAFPTATGITGDGVLYLPPEFTAGRSYPLVVYIHGGPGDPSMLEFDFWAQVMAARGWLVLRPNYRGSPNLGLKYQRAILYDPEEGPGNDIVSAIAAVRARGMVDGGRIAVCGWSYGGIMTAWLISKYHFWRAAVSGASVNDWITDYGTADDSLADRDLLHGSPFVGNEAAEWRRVSPIWYAADVTTPVLILSDVGDNRDPFATSSMYWRALRDNHKDATLRVWPVNGHFPDDPVRTVDVYRYWIDFIAQHFAQ